jgi:peptide/nickel transport system ATP-binding protein
MSLQVTDLRVYYRTLAGDVKALDGVTLAIADGEIMGLAGESGCGKSTLGNSLIRMEGRMKHVGGTVTLDGVQLPIDDQHEMNHFRFAEVSIIPQYAMSALNPTRKIGKMVGESSPREGCGSTTSARSWNAASCSWDSVARSWTATRSSSPAG